MTCDDCPNATDGKCCHQSIRPIPALIFSDATIATLKAQYNKHYGQLGVFDALEQHSLI